MELYYAGDKLTEQNKKDIFELLTECDADFCPPLSARESSVQKSLEGGEANGIPLSYYNAMLEQKFLLACENGRVRAFLTFREHYTCDELQPETDTVYMTTLCVAHDCRGRGLANAVFKLMESVAVEELGCRVLTARTWSTNGAQMHLLPKLGYRVRAVLKDDRGEGIDTVYFQKNL